MCVRAHVCVCACVCVSLCLCVSTTATTEPFVYLLAGSSPPPCFFVQVVRCVHESQVLPAELLEHRGQRDCMWRNTTRRGEDGSVSCWMVTSCALILAAHASVTRPHEELSYAYLSFSLDTTYHLPSSQPEPCATYPNEQVGICPGTFVAKRGKEPPIQSFSNMDERVFVLTGE